MLYSEQIKGFWAMQEEAGLGLNEIALWFYLLDVWQKAGRQVAFRHQNQKVMDRLGIRSYKTLDAIREKLIAAGLLLCDQQQGKANPEYRLTDLSKNYQAGGKAPVQVGKNYQSEPEQTPELGKNYQAGNSTSADFGKNYRADQPPDAHFGKNYQSSEQVAANFGKNYQTIIEASKALPVFKNGLGLPPEGEKKEIVPDDPALVTVMQLMAAKLTEQNRTAFADPAFLRVQAGKFLKKHPGPVEEGRVRAWAHYLNDGDLKEWQQAPQQTIVSHPKQTNGSNYAEERRKNRERLAAKYGG